MSRATPLVLLALAVAWTWPALVTHDLVGTHSDAYGTAWFIHAAPRLFPGFHDGLACFPDGATYSRPDSWVLAAQGALLGWVPAARLHAWLGLVGVWLSAWAASAFASALGARAPWSWLAGLSFAFSGLAAAALLEGYAYHVFDPWLPLLGWGWWRATGPEGRPTQAALAGLGMGAAFWTSAYLGLAATLLFLGIATRLSRANLSALGAFASTALPVLGAWVWLFAAGAQGEVLAAEAAAPVLAQLADALVLAAGPTVGSELAGRPATALLGVTPALFVAAPLLLRRRADWRVLAATGLVALAASFLPRLAPGVLPLPDSLTAALFRFPARLAWAWLLCAGVVGALVLDRLATRFPRAAWALLAAGLVDAFLVVDLPGRQGTLPAGVPSAYLAHEGPLYDLWPEDPSDAGAWDLRTSTTACWYQTEHGRPIGDHCQSPRFESPRLALQPWLLERLLDGRHEAVGERLRTLGYTTLVFHADAFRHADRGRIAHALTHVDPSPVASHDGAEHVLAYRLSP